MAVNAIFDTGIVKALNLETNAYPIDAPVGTITLPASEANYDTSQIIRGGAGTPLELPGPVFALYVKNVDPVASLMVLAAPQGSGLPATGPNLPPGGVYLYWATSENPSVGFTAVTLVSSVGMTGAEVFWAA